MSPAASAQGPCNGTWLPGGGANGISGSVTALTKWDPDGPGPSPQLVVVGGSFVLAGHVIVNNVALWNPTTNEWTPLGAGTNGNVTAAAALPDGRLVIGGDFSVAGGVNARHVAVWDGSAWMGLGGGIDGESAPTSPPLVRAVAGLPDGSIVVGGSFSSASGVPASLVARWNGQAWQPVGEGLSSSNQGYGAVSVLRLDPVTNQLVASGNFTSSGTTTLRGVATWNGSAWTNIGTFTASADETFDKLDFDAQNNLYVASAFRLSRWNRAAWTQLAYNPPVEFSALLGGDAGHYSYATRGYTIFGTTTPPALVMDLSPTAHRSYSGFNVTAMLRLDAESALVAGAGTLSKYQNNTLTSVITSESGLYGSLITQTPDGSLYTVSRGFSPLTVYRKPPGGQWTAVPFPRPTFDDFLGVSRTVSQMLTLRDGSVVANQYETLYKLVNGAWVALGYAGIGPTFYPGGVSDLAELPNGDLVVAGYFDYFGASTLTSNIARWDGQGWRPLGSGLTGGSCCRPVTALAVAPDGDLFAAGSFTSAGGQPANGLARWDGAQWHAVDLGFMLRLSAMTFRPNGNMVAIGSANSGSTPVISEWNGSQWTLLGTPGPGSLLRKIALRPNGDVIVGGSFSSINGTPATNIARWDGARWLQVGDGLGHGANERFGQFEGVFGLQVTANDELYAGGEFEVSGSVATLGVAHALFTGTLPTITQQPADADTCTGYGASFHVTAAGPGPLSYRWTINDQPIDLATNPSAASDTLEIIYNGSLSTLRCTITNGCGSITTNPATLAPAPCCPDTNVDGNIDQGDVDYLLNVVSGGNNPNNIDPDFNHDGNADQNDIDALLNVVAGGACP